MAGRGQSVRRGMRQAMRRELWVAAALLGVAALTSAAAETIPLPTPAPLPKEGAAPPARQSQQSSGPGGLVDGLRSLFNLDKQPEPPAGSAPRSTRSAPIFRASSS